MGKRILFMAGGYGLVGAVVFLARGGASIPLLPALAIAGGVAALAFGERRGWLKKPDELARPITLFGSNESRDSGSALPSGPAGHPR